MAEEKNGTALQAVKELPAAPGHLGHRDMIAAVQARILKMMPGAQDAPGDVVWAAAQLAVAHGLDPFNGELYIMALGNKYVGGKWVPDYRVHVGVKGLRRKAREQAEFMTQFRDMEAGEVKHYRGEDYEQADWGVECRLYRLDVVRTCRDLGIEYMPVVAHGFWRVRAQYQRKDEKWLPDPTPNTWTPQMVAKKRAEINAIKEAFDLNFDVADPAQQGDGRTWQVLAERERDLQRQEALPARRRITQEEDGSVLFATEPDTETRPLGYGDYMAEEDIPWEGEGVQPGLGVE